MKAAALVTGPRGVRSGVSLSVLAAVMAGALISLGAREARAEQFILFDAMITFTWDDAMNSKPSKSHFYVNEGNFLNRNRPQNWLSPVDYRNGTLHVRAEVFEKPPGTQTTGWTLCYIPNAGGYGCADTDYYRSTGIWERETKMTSWWNNSQLQWDKGVKQMDLIYAINDSGSGHVTNYPQLKDQTTPTRVRITMIQVSAGATYDPSILGTIMDGGTAPRPADAGAAADAGADRSSTGTGGTTMPGSGGAGGSSPPPPAASGGSTGSGAGGTGGSDPRVGGNSPAATGCAVATPGRDAGLAFVGIGLALIFAARIRRTRH